MGSYRKSSGKILATDADPRRLDELDKRCARAGASTIDRVSSHDSRALDRYLGRCDLVVLDAPCSGVGTIRRNPDLKLRFTPEQIPHYQALQQKVLSDYSTYVRPGGYLYYMSCSFLPQENEMMIAWFLSTHPHFEMASLIREPDRLSGVSLASLETEDGFLRTDRLDHAWDAFFMARLQRNPDRYEKQLHTR